MLKGVHARHRRKAWLVFIFIVLGPGAVATYYFRNSTAWVNFLSWLALAIAAGTGWAAETPVEDESAE